MKDKPKNKLNELEERAIGEIRPAELQDNLDDGFVYAVDNVVVVDRLDNGVRKDTVLDMIRKMGFIVPFKLPIIETTYDEGNNTFVGEIPIELQAVYQSNADLTVGLEVELKITLDNTNTAALPSFRFAHLTPSDAIGIEEVNGASIGANALNSWDGFGLVTRLRYNGTNWDFVNRDRPVGDIFQDIVGSNKYANGIVGYKLLSNDADITRDDVLNVGLAGVYGSSATSDRSAFVIENGESQYVSMDARHLRGAGVGLNGNDNNIALGEYQRDANKEIDFEFPSSVHTVLGSSSSSAMIDALDEWSADQLKNARRFNRGGPFSPTAEITTNIDFNSNSGNTRLGVYNFVIGLSSVSSIYAAEARVYSIGINIYQRL